MELCLQICLLFVLASVAVGGYAGHGHHHHQHGHYHQHHQSHSGHRHHQQQPHYAVDYYAKPSYQYQYGVHDKYTGDYKTAAEQRDGDKVIGHYALREPDGAWRTVVYTADPHHGFQAQVHRTVNSHPI